jgi:hypothetical protein
MYVHVYPVKKKLSESLRIIYDKTEAYVLCNGHAWDVQLSYCVDWKFASFYSPIRGQIQYQVFVYSQ